MLQIGVDKSINKIIVVTDDLSIKYFFEVTRKENKFIPWKKSWGSVMTTVKIYDKRSIKDGVVTYQFGLGWAGYLVNILSPYISSEDYNKLLIDAIYSPDSPRNIPFPELRDYQNEDILHILKYRVGLLNVYTSYGKN